MHSETLEARRARGVRDAAMDACTRSGLTVSGAILMGTEAPTPRDICSSESRGVSEIMLVTDLQD